jgi:hypothetical protein
VKGHFGSGWIALDWAGFDASHGERASAHAGAVHALLCSAAASLDAGAALVSASRVLFGFAGSHGENIA